jgi:hypothetical protein
MMNPMELFLLQTMDFALDLSQGSQLSAPQINELALKCGIDAPETLRLVEDLASLGFVQQHWGGGVSVTAKGRSALNPESPQEGNVTIGNNSTYVAPNVTIGAGAAIGNEAMAAGAVRIHGNAQQNDLVQAHRELIRVLSQMVAAQQILAEAISKIPEEAREPAKELARETEIVQQELRKPAPDKSGLERRLEKAKGILVTLGGITSAAAQLRPALDLLTRSFDWLRVHLSSMGSLPFTGLF